MITQFPFRFQQSSTSKSKMIEILLLNFQAQISPEGNFPIEFFPAKNLCECMRKLDEFFIYTRCWRHVAWYKHVNFILYLSTISLSLSLFIHCQHGFSITIVKCEKMMYSNKLTIKTFLALFVFFFFLRILTSFPSFVRRRQGMEVF